ncbi:MAG: cupin domain-containing protein, partial [Alphaproteobacteria bacterium]|jgi:quercetin dioxygenase-like cupin family protein
MAGKYPPPPRRIVTGHDADGKAIVLYDGPAENSEVRFNGPQTTLFWGTDRMPASNAGDEDIGERENDVAPGPNGSWFRIVDYPAGFPGRRHKTDTIDYAICMSGEIDMELDDGVEVHMKAGDVMVQRGTVHSWINRGTEPCRIAFILIDAETEGLPHP